VLKDFAKHLIGQHHEKYYFHLYAPRLGRGPLTAAFEYGGEVVQCFEQNAGTIIAKGIVAVFSHTEENPWRGSFFTSHAGLYPAKIGFNCKRALLVL